MTPGASLGAVVGGLAFAIAGIRTVIVEQNYY